MGVSLMAFVAHAQEPDTATGTIRSEEHAEERTQRVEERRGALTERVQTRVRNLGANLSNRMDAIVDRFEQIMIRLESRMDKLDAAGVDTSTARAHLEDARTSLADAQAILSGIDARVEAVATSETPRTAWQDAKADYARIKELLRETHASLRSVVAALKEAVRAVEFGNGVSDAVSESPDTIESETNE